MVYKMEKKTGGEQKQREVDIKSEEARLDGRAHPRARS